MTRLRITYYEKGDEPEPEPLPVSQEKALPSDVPPFTPTPKTEIVPLSDNNDLLASTSLMVASTTQQ